MEMYANMSNVYRQSSDVSNLYQYVSLWVQLAGGRCMALQSARRFAAQTSLNIPRQLQLKTSRHCVQLSLPALYDCDIAILTHIHGIILILSAWSWIVRVALPGIGHLISQIFIAGCHDGG